MKSQLEQEIIQLHADFCSALADTRRLLIVYTLAENPMNVSQLTRELKISQPSVSRHLKILRERGLVKAEREGNSVIYQLADKRLIQALDLLREVMRDQWTRRAELVEHSTVHE